MKTRLLYIILLAQVVTTAALGQVSDSRITGSWIGRLGGQSSGLRLIFNISRTEADSLKATLDSPDQGSNGIKMGRVKFNDTLFFVDAPVVKGNYTGSFVNDTLVKGFWSQGGKMFEVNLTKMRNPLTYKRPQEPKPPFSYKAEEVTFNNLTEGFALAGTLTIPEGKGPFPAVVLITGSGYQDRDETVFNHKPFLVIADYLTRNGIAVLRYDDRGTAGSKGSRSEATSETLAGDARSALAYLKSRPEINSGKIGVAGHSEGGFIAAILAAENKDVAFVVSLAGTGVKGDQIIVRQTTDIMKASGTDTTEISKDTAIQKHLFELLASSPDKKKFVSDALSWYKAELEKTEPDPEKRKEETGNFVKTVLAYNSDWFRYFLTTDPMTFWEKVKCPVLALNGEKDLQVCYSENLPAISEALKKGKNRKSTIISFPGLNHLFQHCTTGLPTEYLSIEETFSPEVLKTMSDWINKTTSHRF